MCTFLTRKHFRTTQVSVSIFIQYNFIVQNTDLKVRLQGAKVDGFEGVKMLELKINRKFKAKGMSPIRLQEECSNDLETRRNDQYNLFKELVQLVAPNILEQPQFKSQKA